MAVRSSTDQLIAESERLRHEMLIMAGRLEVFSELLNSALTEERCAEAGREGDSDDAKPPSP